MRGKDAGSARIERNTVGSERDHGRSLANKVANVGVPEDVGERSRLDPRRVENVADQNRQPSRLLLDEREERFALLGRQLVPARAQGHRTADHRGHRRPQLV
jgi:hypothetical protein